jgi:hypothetical protein
MVNQRPFYERRFALPLRLLPCGVLRCMGRSAERRTAPCGFQIPCSPCPGLRRSGGSIAGALPRKCCQPLFEIGVVGLDFNDEKDRTVPMLPNFFEKILEWMGLI